ncbi:hypothetical protein [Leadbetterella sp. DM7]|uniref:hypothetical protein n=1 Tax=Leadbetterella sp. DM7 TaxID=3235085 RepID=UPI00349E7190
MSLKTSISDFLKIDELKDNLLKIAESKFELKKLELLAKVEKLLAKIVMNVLVAIFIFIIFLLLNILAAAIINYYTRSYWIGYACITGLYSLLFVLFHFCKPWVSRKIEALIADIMVEEQF